MPNNIVINVIEPSGQKLTIRCDKCGNLVREVSGKFLIGLVMSDSSKHILGENLQEIKCCGEVKMVPKSFDDFEGAFGEATRIERLLNDPTSIKMLSLIRIGPKPRTYGVN
ncbi:MAG: hypothetical protein WCG97_03265 [bacterium]